MMSGNGGVTFSGKHLFVGLKSSHSAAFEVGALVDPFVTITASPSDRPPLLCVWCSGYMTSQSVVSTETGQWTCCLCSSVNPAFHNVRSYGHPKDAMASLRTAYPQLSGAHFDAVEVVPVHSVLSNDSGSFVSVASTFSAVTVAQKQKFVFAIEADLCGDSAAVTLLCDGISALDNEAEIALLIYSKQISVLRLGDGLFSAADPLSADILPGGSDQSRLLAHQIFRNLYSTKAAMLKTNIDGLKQGLSTFAPSAQRGVSVEKLLANRVECKLDALVGAALAISTSGSGGGGGGSGGWRNTQGAAGGSHTPTNLILLTSQSLSCRGGVSTVSSKLAPVGSTKNSTKSQDRNAVVNRLSPFCTLGRMAYKQGCSIDVLHASMRATNLDCLEALTSMSGGYVVTGSTYEDEHVRASLMKLLVRVQSASSPFADAGHGTGGALYSAILPTLEVRTCGKVVVDRIVGPIVSAEDVVTYNARGAVRTTAAAESGALSPEAAQLALDSAHLAHSLYFLTDYENQSTKFEDFTAQLVKRNQQQVVLSGINMRCGCISGTAEAHNAITLQLKPVDEKESVNTTSPYANKGNILIGNTGAEEPLFPNSSGVATVQVVVRFYTRAPGNASMLHKVTRVWTQQLTLTTSKEEAARSLHAPLWAHVVSRGIVADYHTQGVESFGGAARNQLDAQGLYVLSSLRNGALDSIDALVRDVAENWPSNTYAGRSKVMEACRALFSLREGPLLDGPAADRMEAYLLRTLFLRTPFEHGLRLLQPALALQTTLPSAASDTLAAPPSQDAPIDPLTLRFPPPSSATHAASAPVPTASAPSSATPAPLHVLYPPPTPAPATTALGVAGSSAADATSLTARYPPPPPPTGQATAVHPSVVSINAGGTQEAPLSVRFPPPRSTAGGADLTALYPSPAPASHASGPPGSTHSPSASLINVPADSTFLLPDTVAALDCGDRITIRRNSPRAEITTADAEKRKQVTLDAVVAHVQSVAASRFPTPRMHVLSRAGTPQDRMLYCRLAPAHTDTVENVLRKLKDAPNATNNTHASSPTEAAARAALKALCDKLTAEDVESIIAQAPFTDQPFFEKYLLHLSPAQASSLFGKLPSGTENASGSSAPPPTSQSMDRGPISVFQPPPVSRAGTSGAYGSEGALPI